MCNTHYDPLLSSLASALQALRTYNDKSMANLDMYCFFLRIKQQQEDKRVAELKKLVEVRQSLEGNELAEEVFIDEKIILDEMTTKTQQRM